MPCLKNTALVTRGHAVLTVAWCLIFIRSSFGPDPKDPSLIPRGGNK